MDTCLQVQGGGTGSAVGRRSQLAAVGGQLAAASRMPLLQHAHTCRTCAELPAKHSEGKDVHAVGALAAVEQLRGHLRGAVWRAGGGGLSEWSAPAALVPHHSFINFAAPHRCVTPAFWKRAHLVPHLLRPNAGQWIVPLVSHVCPNASLSAQTCQADSHRRAHPTHPHRPKLTHIIKGAGGALN